MGWRAWNLSDDGSNPTLWPLGSGTGAWPRRQPLEARCSIRRMLARRRTDHDAPALRCRCGVYAVHSLDAVDRGWPAWPPASVFGRVALWGRIVEHERGWRARFAYPDRLRLACAVCAWIEPGHGVPVVVHGSVGRLITFCDAHAGGIEFPGGRRTKPTDIDPRALQDRLLSAYAVDQLPAEPLESLFRRPAAPALPAYVPSIRLLPSPST